MSATFDSAFARVRELVADFLSNENYYCSPTYQEQEARRDFIDKFWMALGWDVLHDTQKNPFEQEVKVERKEHGASQRRADYAFYIGPNFRDVKFYVEAKKPHADIATADNYFQINRYGWSSQTPIGVLHDFEQFEIVDCRYKPDIATALGCNIRKYHFSHYENAEKFAEIYWLFSREAVVAGSLEKFAESLPKRRGKAVQRGLFKGGYQSIDEAFLQELDGYRDELARAFKNHNPDLDGETLTELTQRTLDRLVFLRFLEDKHIEPQNRIAYFGDKSTAWRDFIAESRRLDGIYNGIVFKEHKILDAPSFKVDDDAFADICETLSHINSPYDFNAVPIHILGSIYERFLGKVIVATDKRAKVEEKPEVRKAGGVYYTPEYIVRYIVENTVGKLIEGKTPAQIAGMKFADIACGSGSFLLGMYDLLIRYHAKYYNENPGKAKKGDVEERDDGLHLTLQKKRQILLNNIFGVDIDAQAVEVSQLSLYLKLLQDETPGSARAHQLEFHETLLPSLNKNIVCGNSLIGTDILEGQLFDPVEERKLNPMNFEDRFPDIFGKHADRAREADAGDVFELEGQVVPTTEEYKIAKKPAAPKARSVGFDAIVGNPPYVRSINLKESSPHLWSLYKSRFKSASAKEWDIYLIFVEKALSILNPSGKLGYILPNKFLNSQVGENLRLILSGGRHLERLLHFGAFQIFQNATTYTCLLFLNRNGTKQVAVARYTGQVKKAGICPMPETTPSLWNSSVVSTSELSGRPWEFSASGGGVLEKMKTFPRLEELVEVFKGTGTNADKVYLVENRGREGKLTRIYSPEKETEYFLEPVFLKPAFRGRSINRYAENGDLLLIVPYEPTDGKMALLAENKLHSSAPKTFKYLYECKARLDEREDGRFKGDGWYCYGRPQNLDRFDVPEKIVLPDVCNRGTCYLDLEGKWLLDTAYAIVKKSEAKFNLRYLLAILNSPLLTYFLKETGTSLRGGYFRMKTAYLNPLPVPPLNFALTADKSRHDKIVALVEQMLSAKKQLAAAKTDKDKTYYENKCEGLDRQIDALVYELYGLSEDEIKIVEGKG